MNTRWTENANYVSEFLMLQATLHKTTVLSTIKRIYNINPIEGHIYHLHKLNLCSEFFLRCGVYSVKKFPAFCGTLRFTDVFIKAHLKTLSPARWLQSTSPLRYFRFIWMFSNLHPCLPSVLISSGFPTKNLVSFLFSLACYMLRP
jgi:hypothetical protein